MIKDSSCLFTAAEAAGMCDGRLIAGSDGSRKICSVVIDSRESRPGALFVPLAGEKTDGHLYIADAVDAGASCVLVASFWEERIKEMLAGRDASLIVVEEPLRGLQLLAKSWISRFPDMIRIGITGSSGKTTTKEILKSVLSAGAATRANPGNLNSEIGLPLSLFSVRADDVYGVFEMGINFKGEMDILAEVYRPQYVVVTNIGAAHSGPLGGEEGVLKEKAKVFAFFSSESRAFLPEDDVHLDFLKKAAGEKVVLFGRKSLQGIENLENHGIEGWSFTYKGLSVRFLLPGEYNLSNLFAAIAVAEYFHVPPGDVKSGIEKVLPLSGRSRIRRGDITVIEDFYNANGGSTREVLGFLGGLQWKGRKIAVLGSMKELGKDSKRIHYMVGEKILESGIDGVFLFGKETEAIRESLEEGNFDGFCFYAETYEELRRQVEKFISPGDIVLVKGSRSMKLERLREILQTQEVAEHV